MLLTVSRIRCKTSWQIHSARKNDFSDRVWQMHSARKKFIHNHKEDFLIIYLWENGIIHLKDSKRKILKNDLPDMRQCHLLGRII